MSDKARKPEDRSNVHKGNRGSPVSNLAPPQLAAAAAAAMMPHGSYEITSSHHMHPHHPLQYSAIIRPPPTIHHMSPHLGRVTNDLGPPIFMPSLNLGVPKLQQQSSPSTSQSNNSGGLPGNSGGSSAASSTTSGSSKTSKSSQPSMNTPTAAFMAPTDLIQFPASAFHSPHGHAMRPPSGGQGAYISASAPPPPSHPSSMNMKFSAPQSLSSSTIAKPTPIPASATSSGIVRPTPKSVTNSQGAGAGVKREQQPTSASSKGVMSSSATKGEPPSTSVNLMYGFAPHPMMSYGILNAAAVTATPPSHGQLSKMLLGGSQHPSSHPPPPPSSASRSSKGDGSNGSSKAAASQVASSAASGASHKSGSYIVDGYTNRSSMGLSTSAQPTSTAATYMDTKMEHPPQPSAVPILPQHGISSLPLPHPPSSSSSSPSTAYTLPSPPSPSSSATASGSGGGGKDRPTTAEAAASNLIISKQALTGKQIASITGNSCSSGGGGTTTTTLGQSSSTIAAETSSSCSSYATSPVSNSNLIVMATVASSLGAGGGGGGTASGGNRSNSSADFVMLSQSQGQEGSVMEWSSSSQQQQQQQGRSTSSVSSSMSSATGSGGSVVVAPSSSSSMAEQQQQQGGGGGSSVHSSHHNHHHHTSSNGGASRDAVTSSISATTAASSSFSGHLSAGGGGGVMGSPSKSLTASPGGGTTSSPRPHILRGVKRPHESSWKENSHHNPGSSTFLNKLSNTNSCAKQKVSRQDYGAPISPGSHEMGGGLSNHLSSKSEPPDMTASPRKKPRKQNVVANDDQYASNVPDSFVSMGTSEAQLYHEGGRTQGEELGSKSQPLFYNSISSRNARVKTESRDAGVGKEVEMRYLSQLKKCPYPINGVYKVHHRAARNHFRRHADIKHREDHRPSVCEIADDKTSLQRASGWKIIHFSSQLQEMSEVEEDILKTMQRLQDSVNNLDQTGTCQVDPECTGSFKELVQGNLDRSNRVLSHISDTKLEIEKVLEHKPQVSELLKKFSTQKPSAQSIRNSSSNHQHKNCS